MIESLSLLVLLIMPMESVCFVCSLYRYFLLGSIKKLLNAFHGKRLSMWNEAVFYEGKGDGFYTVVRRVPTNFEKNSKV